MSASAHHDFKGHHPKIRIYIPHQNGCCKVKIVLDHPKGWLLTLLRLRLFKGSDCFESPEALGMEALNELMVVETGSAGSNLWYVDTAGCGMLQANDANPPPRQHGVVRKAMQYAAAVMLALMLLVWPTSCKKDPNPTPTPNIPTDTITPDVPTDTIVPPIPGDTITPVTPGDTITPVVPGDTIVPNPPTPGDTIQPGNYDTIPGRKVEFLLVKPGNSGIRYPTRDTILFYANHPGCDSILLKWKVPPNLTSGWTPDAFHSPRDSLKIRFAVSDKVFGNGKINVNKNYGGASIPCADSLNISVLGMTECDSAIFAGWGYTPYRDPGTKSREEHIKFIDTVGMSRAILGRTR